VVQPKNFNVFFTHRVNGRTEWVEFDGQCSTKKILGAWEINWVMDATVATPHNGLFGSEAP
jgi:hypothetical protein